MPEINGQYSMNPQLAQTKADQQPDGGKVHAEDAKYQDVAGTCASCAHFSGDGQPCQVIVEPVSAGGWCSLFSEGQSAQAAPAPDAQPSSIPAATPQIKS